MRRVLALILACVLVLPLLVFPALAATLEQNWIVTCNETDDSGEQYFFNEVDADRITFTPTVKAAQLDGYLTIYEDISYLQIILRYDNFTPIAVDAYSLSTDYQITYNYTRVEYENWDEYTVIINCPTGYTNYPVNIKLSLIGNVTTLGETCTFFVPTAQYTSASGNTSTDDKVLEYWAWLSDSFVVLLNLLVDWWDDLKADMLNQYNGIVAAISTEITRLSTELSGYITTWKNQWVTLYNGQILPRLDSIRTTVNNIYSAIVGDTTADDDMQDAMDDAANDAKEDLDILDDVTMPVPDNIQGEIDVDALVDGNDVQMLTDCLSPILEGVVFLPVFMVCLVMSLAAYVLYGKR